jgi:hypothetical protein
MYVKPLVKLVRDPKTLDHLPPEGREVPRDTFWLRLIKEGDVVECKPPEVAEVPEVVESSDVT